MITTVRVRVSPNAREETVTVEEDEVQARVSAPPIDGKANSRLQILLAERLELPKSSVTVVRGFGSRVKTVEVEGIDRPTVMSRLAVDPARESRRTKSSRRSKAEAKADGSQ